MKFRLRVWIPCMMLATSPLALPAQQLWLDSLGARFGFGANQSSSDFHQADAVFRLNTPVVGHFGNNWWIRLQAMITAGWLGDPGHDAFIGSAGPAAALGQGRFPVTLNGSVCPTFISRPDFGTKNFGSNAQFTSSGGLDFDLGSEFRLSYRFQHMSNAGLSIHNPGLNLHMFGVSYAF